MLIDEFIAKLDHCKEVGARRKNLRSFIAKCPSHADNSPSLYIDLAPSGNILLRCWTGCGGIEIARSVGVEPHELFPEDGDYQSTVRGIKKDINFDSLNLAMHKDAIMRGDKLSKADRKSGLKSYMAMRNK